MTEQTKEILFVQIVHALAKGRHRPPANARLTIPDRPTPFVSPTFTAAAKTAANPFAAEVIFVEASAAVGKSTMAHYLSAFQNAPLLDLAIVPVSTGSLKSLVSDLDGDDPIAAFHAGTLPIVIDALDEGRLLSNETGFDSFLQTTGEFLLQDRQFKDRPKIVILGRHDSIQEAQEWMELVSPDIATSTVEVAFFSENDARQLIDRYADTIAEPDAQYRRHPEPARQLVDSYFDAIESALGLAKGTLWSTPHGRAFAGYAPVLAALGSLLANMDNFSDVTNRLRSEGRQEAWSVLETVLAEILNREKKKVCDKLGQRISVPVPAEAYDAREQLTLLSRYLHNKPLNGSSRVKLPPSEQVQYATMVRQYIGQHPFVRHGKPSNAVLGSLVLAHAILEDLLHNVDLQLVTDMSRQPFLWRSVRSRIGSAENALIDGKYLGFVLSSYWSDPIKRHGRVTAETTESEFVRIAMPTERDTALTFFCATPLIFNGQIRDIDIDVDSDVSLIGHSIAGGSSFFIYGKTVVVAKSVQVISDALYIDGQFWLEADDVIVPPRLSVRPKKGAEFGWGGNVAAIHPWSGYTSTLAPPYRIDYPGDVLSRLINECASRLPNGVLVVTDEHRFSESENRWVARMFPNAFPQLIKLLIEHGLAHAESFGTYAQIKNRIHMNTTWGELQAALRHGASDAKVAAFLIEAKRAITQA